MVGVFSECARMIPKTQGLRRSCQGPEKPVASYSCLFSSSREHFREGDRNTTMLPLRPPAH